MPAGYSWFCPQCLRPMHSSEKYEGACGYCLPTILAKLKKKFGKITIVRIAQLHMLFTDDDLFIGIFIERIDKTARSTITAITLTAAVTGFSGALTVDSMKKMQTDRFLSANR